jgi:hypothetical protein
MRGTEAIGHRARIYLQRPGQIAVDLGRKKRGRRSAASGEAVRYDAKNGGVIGVIRGELRDAQKRVSALKAILRKYSRL